MDTNLGKKRTTDSTDVWGAHVARVLVSVARRNNPLFLQKQTKGTKDLGRTESLFALLPSV